MHASGTFRELREKQTITWDLNVTADCRYRYKQSFQSHAPVSLTFAKFRSRSFAFAKLARGFNRIFTQVHPTHRHKPACPAKILQAVCNILSIFQLSLSSIGVLRFDMPICSFLTCECVGQYARRLPGVEAASCCCFLELRGEEH